MSDKTQVNIRVLSETKDDWDDAVVGSPEYDSLTHLITLSVQKELYDGQLDQSISSEPTASADAIRDDVIPALKQLQRSVENLDSRIDRLESTVEAEGPEYDVETAIIDVLPTPEESGEHDWPRSWGMTVSEIRDTLHSRGIMIDKPDIRDAVDGLAESIGYIKKQDGSPEAESGRDPVYWRQE